MFKMVGVTYSGSYEQMELVDGEYVGGGEVEEFTAISADELKEMVTGKVFVQRRYNCVGEGPRIRVLSLVQHQELEDRTENTTFGGEGPGIENFLSGLFGTPDKRVRALEERSRM